MAWDDASPDQDLTSSGAWDSAPPDKDLQPSYLEKTASNIVPDIKSIGTGLKDLVSGPALDIASGDIASAAPKLAKQATDFWKNPKENAEAMVRPVTHPIDYFQEHPVSQALNVAGAIGGISDLMENVPRGNIAEAPKELPVVEPGAKTGDPHALFAYNDKFGPGGADRSIYNVFGDPKHEVFQEHGWGSSIPAEELGDIPVTGRQPNSSKFEPIQGIPKPAPTAAELPAENTIGQRLKARTTAQALDINPLAMRKLAAKAGTTPENYVLELGDKANELIPNLVEPMDSANSKFGKVIDAHDDAGVRIGQIAKSVTRGTTGSLPEGQEAINALRKAADEYYQVDGGDLALQKTADRLESLQKAGKLDFDRLSKVKSDIGKGFNKTDPPPGTEDIYHIMDDNAQKVVDRLTVQDPTLAPELAKLKQIYTVTSRLIPAMSRTAAKEVAGANVGGGLFSKAIPSAVGGVLGGPMGALAGAGAKYIQEAIAPDLGKNLAYMAMKGSPEMIAKVKGMIPGISDAAAASIAARMMPQKKKEGMFKGGVVPDDVKNYVRSKGC